MTFVMRPCMMRKCGLLTFMPTILKRSVTRVTVAAVPLIWYVFRPLMMIWNEKR